MLLEGTIDLAFEDADELVVLDFKTDRELTTDFDQYRRQVDVYCRAIGAVKGKTARGILLARLIRFRVQGSGFKVRGSNGSRVQGSTRFRFEREPEP